MDKLLAIAAFVGTAFGTLISSVIGQMSSKYLFRAVAVTAMAGAFWVAFEVMYSAIKSALGVAVGYAVASQATLGVSLDFGLCLIPSTLPEAITVIFAVMIQAVAVRWTRMVLFAKLA